MTKKIEDCVPWKALVHAHRFFLALFSFIVVVIITASVVMRYVLKTDLYGLEEIEILLAMWIYFIGGSYGSYERSHITADIMNVIIKNPKILHGISIFVTAVSLAVSIFFAVWGIQYWNLIFMIGGNTPGLKIPLPLQRMPLTIGFVLMVWFNLYHFVCAVLGRKPIILDADDETVEGTL